jgi:hypothetical protein
MVLWPIMWQQQALAALGVPDSDDTFAIMTAWQASTPLPPYSYNPLGMPAGSNGAKAYLGTPYAQFGSIGMFYAALKAFGSSYQGSQLAQVMRSDNPYPATWRAVSALKWPGSQTETDYPSALLDLTSQSYRASVNASTGSARKTSGMVTSPDAATTSALSQARAVNQATQAFADAKTQVSFLLRSHARGQLRVFDNLTVSVNRDQPCR